MEIKIKKPSAMIQTNVKKLTLTQRKIINFLIFIAQKEGENKLYTTNIKTVRKMCKIRKTENIDLKEQFKALKKIDIEFNYLDKDKNNVWEITGVLSMARIMMDTGKIIFEIPYGLREKIMDPNIYSPLNILLIAGLKSKYSIVLYELFRDYLHSPTFPQLTIYELKKLLGIEKGKYKEFFNFKKRVLDRAVDEINKKTDIICSYSLIKNIGNKYSHIKFEVKKNKDFKLIKPRKIIEGNNLYLSFDSLVLPKEVLKTIPEKYQIESIYNTIQPYLNELEYLISNIKYTNKNHKENYLAYLKLSLKNDYAKPEREVKENKKKITRNKKSNIQEKENQEKLLKQKTWNYFNALPEDEKFNIKIKAEKTVKDALKMIKKPEMKKSIIEVQIEKDLIELFVEK